MSAAASPSREEIEVVADTMSFEELWLLGRAADDLPFSSRIRAEAARRMVASSERSGVRVHMFRARESTMKWRAMTWIHKESGRACPSWYCRIAHSIDLEVFEMIDGSYSVRVAGNHVAGGIIKLEGAKAKAIAWAKNMLATALDELLKDEDERVAADKKATEGKAA